MSTAKNTGLYIFVFFVAVYAFLSIGHFGGDGYQDYLTAESIVLDGNLALHDRPDDVDEIEYVKGAGLEGVDGKIYSSRSGMGMPLILAPFYVAGNIFSKIISSVPHDYITMLAVSFANPVMTAIACLLVFIIAGKLKFSVKVASILSVVYGLSTMAPVYARTGFAESAVTMFILLGISAAISYKKNYNIKQLILTAVFLSAMCLCKASSVIFVPCFLIYIVWILVDSDIDRSRQWGHIATLLLIVTCAGGAILLLNYAIYGKATAFGGVNAVAIGKRIAGAPHMIKGVYYYLLSTGKGFFLFNIPTIFAFFALKDAIKKDKKTTVLFLLIFIVNLLFYVKSFRRGSLFSWGPRYLLPSVPVLVLLSGYYLENIKGLMKKGLYCLGGAIGFLIILPCMLVNQSKFYLFVVEKLRLDEYMINFIPDLSPIKGAWAMLLNRMSLGINGEMPLYVYAPDYRLVEPVAASMEQYNYLDIWFLKVIETAPGYSSLVYGILFVLAGIAVFSAWKITRIK